MNNISVTRPNSVRALGGEPAGRVIASRTTAASQAREGNVTGDAMLIELEDVTKTYGKVDGPAAA